MSGHARARHGPTPLPRDGTLVAALRAYIDARGITTAQLAAEWDVPARTLEGWLAGRTPTHPGLVRAALASRSR